MVKNETMGFGRLRKKVILRGNLFLEGNNMPRPRMNPDHVKINITLRLPKELVERLKAEEGYNNLVEILLKDYFLRKDQKN